MAEKTPKIRFAALWSNTSQDGKTTYLSGPLGDVRLLIFPNGYKQKPTDPDFIAYVTERQRRQDQTTTPAGAPPDDVPPPDDSDIPF